MCKPFFIGLILLAACGGTTPVSPVDGDTELSDMGVFVDQSTTPDSGSPRDATVAVDSAIAVDLTVPLDLSPLPDLSRLADLSRLPDLATPDMAKLAGCPQTPPNANASCADLNTLVTQWIDCNRPCGSVGGCTTLNIAYGVCINPCPVNVGINTDGPYLQGLLSQIQAMKCGRAGCACVMPHAAVCAMGACQ